MNAHDKIIKARAGLVLDMPFFASLALRMKVVEDTSCETAWTDGTTMGYNPSFIEGLELAQVKGIICHETMHCGMSHMTRRGNRNHQKWNQAGDYAINSIIEKSGLTLPDGRLLNPAYDGMSADEIYSLLPDPPKDGSADPGGCGEVRDATGDDDSPASSAELTQLEQDWKIAVSQATIEAKSQGNMPAGLDRIVEEILEPKLNWKEILRRFVDMNARNNYQWFPPNRRYIHMGLYLPGLKSEELPPIVVAVDTSGSVRPSELAEFAAEITAILEEHPSTTCQVIYCDHKVTNVEEFTSDDLPLTLHPKGGGGTEFKPVFDWVAEHDIIPSCLIYLTDMQVSRFPDAPEYPVLWVRTDKRGIKAPFGEEVDLK